MIKNPIRHFALWMKISGFIFVVVVAIDAFQLFYFPSLQVDQLTRSLKGKATSLSQFIALRMGDHLEVGDKPSVTAALKGAAMGDDCIYGALYAQDGAIFAAHRIGRAKTLGRASFRPATENTFEQAEGLLQITAPVRSKNGVRGTLVLGFSTSRLQKEVASIRNGTWRTGAVILVIGGIFALLVGISIGRRLTAIEAIAEAVAKGDLSSSVEADDARDEIGRITRSIEQMLSSLRKLQAHVIRVAQGDLSETATLEGDLAKAFNSLIINQRKMVGRIDTTAISLTAAAQEFQANAEQQQRGALEQSSSVEENRRTMEGLLETARRIAETAQTVLDNAEHANRNSRQVAEHIAALTAHTEGIADILAVIKEIANKSDVLALNAALEGTKAGVVGRGFSLVAAQMQRLAENVMKSVTDIRELTTTITESTHSTVLSTEESTKIAADTTRSARQIAMIVQQQQRATEQVSEAMEDVAKVAQQTAAGGKQVVSSTKDLVEQAYELQSMVKQFKV